MSALELLERLQERGVRLRTEQGELSYSAPSGALTSELRAEIASRRTDLIDLLAADLAWRAAPELGRRYQPFALTDLQQAYLVGEQDFYAHHAPALLYHEYDLDDIDPVRLESALRRVSDGFDVMRLSVDADGNQRFRPAPDRGPLLARAVATEIGELRASVGSDLPPLDAGRPYLVRLVRLPGSWRLQVAMRLVAFDGVTTQLFYRELGQAYADPEYRPEPDAFSFRDYVEALHASRSGRRHQESMRYWLDRLDQLSDSPDLPIAPKKSLAPEQAAASGPLARVSHRLDSAAWQRFRALAAQAGVPAGSAFFALFAEALRRFSGESDATVTVLAAHRPPGQPGIATVWGNCSTTVPVRLPASGGTFAERAKDAQARLYADLAHSSVSGIEVTRRRRQRGTGSRLPVVFTSGLDLVATDAGFLLPLPGAKLIHSTVSTPQVVLDHQVYEEDDELVCNLDYAVGRFPAGMIEELAEYHRTRLNLLSTDASAWIDPAIPDLPPSQLAERRQANRTVRTLPAGLLSDGPRAAAARQPGATAVITADRVLDHGTLEREACQLASRLRATGIGPGDLVAIVLPRGWSQVLAALAVTRAGAGYLPIDVRWPHSRIATVLTHSRTSIVISDSATRIPSGRNVLRIDAPPCQEGAVTEEQDPSAETGGRFDLDSTGYVIYTSGSTGAPKGVEMTHRATVNTLQDLLERFRITAADRVLAVSALSFDLSVFDIFATLTAGATMVVPPDSAVPDPHAWAQCVRQHGVTVWNSVPALLDLLLEYLGDRAGEQLASLRLVMLSGDWLPLPLLARIRAALPAARIVSLGGATEAAIWSNWFDTEHQPADWTSVPYGYPLANQSLHVLDSRLAPAPTWVPGDLYLGGIGLARGYLHDPERTAAAFIRHPVTGERLYSTGDRARYRPGGIVEFLGRQDTQVKINGFRIELGEIEALLVRRPEVATAVVVVDPRRGLAAFVTGAADLEPESLRAHLAEQLPAYMVPNQLLRVESFPLSSNGKVDRAALTVQAADRGVLADSDTAHMVVGAPLRTHNERRLAEVWSQVLSVPVRSADADFFALGGDSLLAVRLFHRLEQCMGRRLPLSSLFNHGTIAAQARLLDADEGSHTEPVLVPIRPGSGPRLVLIHPVGGNLLCYQELAAALRAELGTDPEVLGLRSVGLQPGEALPSSVPAMLTGYLAELQRACPEEALHLAGWSMGGVLALALANRLAGIGRPAVSVVAVDGFAGQPAGESGSPENQVEAFFADLCGGTVIDEALPADLAAAQGVLHDRGLLRELFDVTHLKRLFAVYENNSRLLRTARPPSLPAGAVLIRTATPRESFKGLAPLEEVLAERPARSVRLTGEDHYSVMRGAGARRVAAIIATAIKGKSSDDLPQA